MKKILVLILIYTSIQASWKISMDDFYHNYTSGGSTTLNDGRTFAYTPNLIFKLKNNGKTFVPWFGANIPVRPLKLGCNGMSLDSMFGSLVGMEQIIGDLENAAKSALTGAVMMALDVSFPTLSAVAKSINKLARRLQALMQDACKMGQNLVKGTKLEGALKFSDSWLLGDVKEGGTNSVSRFVDSLDSASEKIEAIRTMDDVDVSGILKEALKSVSLAFAMSVDIVLNVPQTVGNILHINKSSKFNSFSKRNIRQRNTRNKISVNSNGTIVPGDDNIPEKGKNEFMVLWFALFGDLGIDEEAKRTLEKLNTKDSVEAKELASKISVGSFQLKGKNIAITPDWSLSKVITFLLDGSQKACGNSYCKINIPDTLYVNLPDLKGVFLTPSYNYGTGTQNYESLKSDGLVPKFADCLQKRLNILRPLHTNVLTNIDTLATNEADCNSTIQMIPQYDRYLKIIKIEEAKAGKNILGIGDPVETSRTYNLKILLSNLGAYFSLRTFFDDMEFMVNKKSRQPSSTDSTNAILSRQLYVTHTQYRIKTVKEMIKDRLIGITETLKTFNSIFESVEEEHTQSILKNLQ